MTGITDAEQGHLQAGTAAPRRAEAEEGVQIRYPQPWLQGITAVWGIHFPLKGASLSGASGELTLSRIDQPESDQLLWNSNGNWL